MRKKLISITAVLGILLLWGCYPHGPEYTEDLDLVVTYHNPDYDFAAKGTYSMPDRVVKVTGNLVEGDEPEFIPDIYGSKIIESIEENMTDLGWTRVTIDASPDVVLMPASWESTTIYYYYDYWYWWWGGYYPYYPYYPPVYGSYSYTTGTLLMTMIDPSVTGANGTPKQQWTAAINGLLTETYDAVRFNALLGQVFEQSPYLKTN